MQMKTTANSSWAKFRQTSLVLFVMLFLCIVIVPVFHHHGQNPVCRHLHCDDTEKIQLTDKCAVCDYIHHVQAQPVVLPGILSLPIIHPEVINLDTWLPCGNYSFILPGFPTRGPPMLIS